MSLVHDLVVAFRRWQHVRRHGAAPPPPSLAELRAGLDPALRAAAGKIVAHELVELPANRPPWLATSLTLEEGEEVTLFASGRVWLSKALDLWVGPQFQLWARVGEGGTIFNGTRDTNSFVASHRGRLYLGGQFPGQFADRRGRVQTSLREFAAAQGGLHVLAVRWKGGADEGLEAMAATPGLSPEVAAMIAGEQARLASPPVTPAGWQYLWFLGESGIYAPGEEEGRACIHCRTRGTVGILQRETPLALTSETELAWEWRVTKLPSRLAEDTAASHDYLSIAVEFENGRDLTYYWSSFLPEGRGYWCPLPTWNDREFHVVVRSGAEGLGHWTSERRNLHQDYGRYIGPPPERIVRVWLIANSMFQRDEGAVDYRNIRVETGLEAQIVL